MTCKCNVIAGREGEARLAIYPKMNHSCNISLDISLTTESHRGDALVNRVLRQSPSHMIADGRMEVEQC